MWCVVYFVMSIDSILILLFILLGGKQQVQLKLCWTIHTGLVYRQTDGCMVEHFGLPLISSHSIKIILWNSVRRLSAIWTNTCVTLAKTDWLSTNSMFNAVIWITYWYLMNVGSKTYKPTDVWDWQMIWNLNIQRHTTDDRWVVPTHTASCTEWPITVTCQVTYYIRPHHRLRIVWYI
jgi:hypothetical protein